MRIERTLQHLVDPDQAVAEIARILKVGGRAALVEPDWETMVIEGSDPELSTLIWTTHLARNRQPRIGRRLGGMLASNGFDEVDVDATVASVTRV